MAIGTAAAIGLGVAGIGSALGASATRSAAKRAANTAQQTTAQNNALAREIYGKNQVALSPFMQRGNAAGDAINALLGLAPQQPAQQQQFAPQQPQQNPFGGGYNPTGVSPLSRSIYGGFEPMMTNTIGGFEPGERFTMGNNGFQYGFEGFDGPMGGYGMAATSAPAGPTAQQQQAAAFDNFRNSTGYQFRLGEGMNALNSGFAGAGTLQSGAALRAAQEYGQNFASNEFNNYMGLLSNQQAVGLGGASALAGVGQNYVNTVSANNNNAGSAAANAALIRGQSNPFASALGAVGGFAMGMGPGIFGGGGVGGGGGATGIVTNPSNAANIANMRF